MTDELKHTSYQAVPKCLIPNWLFFFFLFCSVLENNKEAIQSMYTAVSAIQVAVQFKDVHGVAFLLRSLLQLDKKINDIGSRNYDANHRSTDPSQGAHKIMHITLLL